MKMDKKLSLMDERDALAQEMHNQGWTLEMLGANYLNVSVAHFSALVEQGTYDVRCEAPFLMTQATSNHNDRPRGH